MSSSSSSVNALRIGDAVRSRPKKTDPLAFDRRFMTWRATDTLGVETGFRMDVAVDSRTGATRGIRVVPLVLEVDGEQPPLPLSAVKKLTREALAEATSEASSELPPELQAQVDDLVASSDGRMRRPNLDSKYVDAWHKTVLAIVDWADSPNTDRPAAYGVIARAFGVNNSTATRWISDAEAERSALNA